MNDAPSSLDQAFRALQRCTRWIPPKLRKPFGVLHFLAVNPRRTLAEQIANLATGKHLTTGPFAGMSFHVDKIYYPYLLGTYELELEPLLEQLLAHPYDTLINVGAGDGFYAVGMARRLPQSRVIAFEMDGIKRERMAELAAVNNVTGQITIQGECTLANLATAIESGRDPLLLMDVEGAEQHLLDPAAVPALARTTVLIEMHDLFVPGVSDLIRSRFESTHAIQCIATRPREASDLRHSLLRGLVRMGILRSSILHLMEEARMAAMTWLLLTPRQ